jgi:prepilin-type N-terminal cleavage/methylation domain-containing protein
MRVRSSQAGKHKEAFTLVELLVVLSMIGILSAFLLTSISTSKALASRTQCVNNLRQISCAIHIYATDDNGRVPTFADNEPFWRISLQPYAGLTGEPTKADRIFICPNDPAWFAFPYSSFFFSSYVYNGYYVGTDEPRLWWKLDEVRDPSRSVLTAEAGAKLEYFSFHETPTSFGITPPYFRQTYPKNVFLFTDGHASYLKTFHDWSAGIPSGYFPIEPFWSPEPPSEFGYTWNVN